MHTFLLYCVLKLLRTLEDNKKEFKQKSKILNEVLLVKKISLLIPRKETKIGPKALSQSPISGSRIELPFRLHVRHLVLEKYPHPPLSHTKISILP